MSSKSTHGPSMTELSKLLLQGYTIEEAIAILEDNGLPPSIDLDQMDAKRDGEDWWND